MVSEIRFEIVQVEKPAEINLILGQTHFIKSVEDIYEAVVSSVPGIRFGLAFAEASGDRLIRCDGTDAHMVQLARENMEKIACGHSFIIFLDRAFPINVLNSIKNVQEVCRIFCATANPLQVVVGKTSQGRGIMGVIDGEVPLGIENEEKEKARKDLLRKFGYKR